MNDLSVIELKKIYKNGSGINNVNLNVKKGEIHAFLGENGAGKSTTMKCIMGMEGYDSGKIEILGNELKIGNSSIRGEIGYSPELPALPKQFTGKECLETYGYMRGLRRNDIKKEIRGLLELTDLENAGDNKVGNYSRGMLAKLDFAIAMLGDPELLILDEPTAGLDPVSANSFREILKEISKSKRTILLSSHQLSDVEKICSGVTIIHKGKTILEGNMDDILKKNIGENTFKVEFTVLNKSLLDRIKKLEGIDIISKNNLGNTLMIQNHSKEDIRPNIARAATEENALMLSFNEETTSLENVFINLLKEYDKNEE